MKKECDKNGLDYEILLQDDSAKERFLRQVHGYHPASPFSDYSKNFVIMKQKREPAPTRQPHPMPDPVIGAANPNSNPPKPTETKAANPESESPIVGAANPNANAGDDQNSPNLGMAAPGRTGAAQARTAIAGNKFPKKNIRRKYFNLNRALLRKSVKFYSIFTLMVIL